MKRTVTLIGSWLAIVVYSLSLTAAPALAATSNTGTQQPAITTGQALEIAPPVVTLSVNPGQSTKVQIFLRDVSPSTVVVTGQVNDFVAAGEDGTPKILLEDKGNNPYSIKGWIPLVQSLRLAPREVKSLTVSINVPKNASPGGHYGIIRFTATAPQPTGTGVSLNASLGALLLITVSGKVKESLSVQQFTVSHNKKTGKIFESTPLTFTTRLKNSGNIHEQPVGQIIVKDMFGRDTASVNVNLPPRNVLPQSVRKFESQLDSTVIGNKKLFGHYSANLTITYGADKQKTTSSVSFWVIPYRLMAVIIIVLVAGFFVLRAFIRRYNRRIITKAQNKQ